MERVKTNEFGDIFTLFCLGMPIIQAQIRSYLYTFFIRTQGVKFRSRDRFILEYLIALLPVNISIFMIRKHETDCVTEFGRQKGKNQPFVAKNQPKLLKRSRLSYMLESFLRSQFMDGETKINIIFQVSQMCKISNIYLSLLLFILQVN